LLAETSMTQ
jgi:hypothetical protein